MFLFFGTASSAYFLLVNKLIPKKKRQIMQLFLWLPGKQLILHENVKAPVLLNGKLRTRSGLINGAISPLTREERLLFISGPDLHIVHKQPGQPFLPHLLPPRDAHTDADRYTDTDADRDTDTDADRDTDTDADMDTDTDADRDTTLMLTGLLTLMLTGILINTDLDRYAVTEADKDTETDADKGTDSDAERDSDPDADRDTLINVDIEPDMDADRMLTQRPLRIMTLMLT